MMRIIPLLFLAFNVWMLVDVVRRSAPIYWVFIILFVPLGGIIYFFAIKLKDFRSINSIGDAIEKTSLKSLKDRYEDSPSLENQMTLAQGLIDAKKHADAADIYDQVIDRYPENKDALFGLGVCKIAQKQFDKAVPPLKKLIDIHQGYNDYAAWTLLTQALWEDDHKEDCLEELRRLNKFSPKFEHQLILIHCLVQMEKSDEARTLIDLTLDDLENEPNDFQQKHKKDAALIKKMRNTIS